MANRLFAGLVALAFELAPGAPAFAKMRMVRGQLVDKVCYLQDQKANAGDSHPGMAADCATTCAQKGSTVALVSRRCTSRLGSLREVSAPGTSDFVRRI